MQQRQLRLGDTLDDYCPRERRVTNHVIVAMVEQDIKQTRCTTCEAEHEYKHAKVPPQRRKKTEPGTLYKDVLAGLPRKPLPPTAGNGTASARDPEPVPASASDEEPAPVSVLDVSVGDTDQPEAPPAPPEDGAPDVEGPVHRPLIRATLPRPEGQPPARPIPEFTARQAVTRPGRRPPGGRGPRGAPYGFSGSGQPAGAGRSQGGRRGQGMSAGVPHGGRARAPHQVQGHPQGQGQGGQRRRGGKKRFK